MESRRIVVDVASLSRGGDPLQGFKDRVGIVEYGDVPPTAPLAEPARVADVDGHLLAARHGGAQALFKPLGQPPRWLVSHMVRLGHNRRPPATIYSSWQRPWTR
jgi:hypothetical protein